jgi:mRNA interferase RelE/StbE
MTYRVELTPPAVRALDRLPRKALDAVLAFMDGPLAKHPYRVGKQLRHEFEGLHSARFGPYRLLYDIRDEVRIVAVIRIAHRADVSR